MPHFAKEVKAWLPELETALKASEPLLLLLSGPLGAGKTTLVQELLTGLGLPPGEVQSPTFLKILEYQIPPHRILHLDCYRIEEERDFAALGLEVYGSDHPPGLWLVEWPENFLKFLESDPLLLSLLNFHRVWKIELSSDHRLRREIERWA